MPAHSALKTRVNALMSRASTSQSGARPKTWMAGTSPAMTWWVRRFRCKSVSDIGKHSW